MGLGCGFSARYVERCYATTRKAALSDPFTCIPCGVFARAPCQFKALHAIAGAAPCTVASYLEHALPRPLLDLDDHLVHLEVRQKGRYICSVAREAREVFRRHGIIFENIRARVDCSDDDTFPPEAAPVSTKYFVIRKSDGHMAVLRARRTTGLASRRAAPRSAWELLSAIPSIRP